MNSGQTAVATIGTAVIADSLIGGIGIGMLGTAVGIPAAAVVATVGGTVAAAKFIDEKKPAIKAWAANKAQVYWLKRDNMLVRFRVQPISQTGCYSIQDLTDKNSWFNQQYYHPVEKLRLYYKNFLDSGYEPTESYK